MTWAYLGMQLGGVLSTSQVAKSFMGTGLRPDEPIRPAILKLEEMTEAELLEAVEAAENNVMWMENNFENIWAWLKANQKTKS